MSDPNELKEDKDALPQVGAAMSASGEWREFTIGEIADVVGGGTPSTKQPENFGGDIPWLTPKDLSGPHDRYIDRGQRSLSQRGLNTSSARLVPAGSVLLSTRAPIGYVALAKNPIATNQGFRNLVMREGFLSEYLYYWLTTNVDQLEQHASGSTFRELSGSALKAIRLHLPPLTEQRRIAYTLGTLDDRIELNRRMIKTLEDMVGALFKSWFVDFDPVRAKVEGIWKHGESLPGLPSRLYDLFPDRLVPSRIGEIPEGWAVTELGDVLNVLGGTTPSTKVEQYWSEGTHYWATPRDLSSLSTAVLLNTKRKITDAGLAKIGSGLLPMGTVLLSSRAPIGYVAISEVPVAINQGFIAMPPSDDVSNVFLLFWCRAFRREIMCHANGSTFLEISKREFRRILFLRPSEKVADSFERYVRSIYGQIVCHARQAHTLSAKREALLPKLVSGAIRVTDAHDVTDDHISM